MEELQRGDSWRRLDTFGEEKEKSKSMANPKQDDEPSKESEEQKEEEGE